jgi:hypothetical protein
MVEGRAWMCIDLTELHHCVPTAYYLAAVAALRARAEDKLQSGLYDKEG